MAKIILVNQTNFDQDWAAESLIDVIRPDMHVVILPLAYDEGWASDAEIYGDRFEQGSEYRDDLERPFMSYGIPRDHISFLDYYVDDPEDMRKKINASDIFVIVGNDPVECMHRIEDLGLEETIRSYQGVLIGISDGAKVLMDEFYRTPDEDFGFAYNDGLGILPGVDLDVHYYEDPWHLGAIIRSLEERGKPLIIMPDAGGVLFDGANMELLGNAFIAGPDDLDEVYKLYQEVSEGQS